MTSHASALPSALGVARVPFPFMSAEAFVSDTDRAALANLQRMPLLPIMARKFNEFAVDRIFYAQNSAESVRCGPKQFTTLYNLMREACSILHIPEPELYVKYSYTFNAYTAGVQRTFITLHSSLVEHFTEEELLFILGHEVGHIKCGHVLYSMMAQWLLPMLEAVGHATLGLGQLAGMGLVSAFFEWLRQAEFSCDRAGMLACQNPRASLSALMKLGCGSTRYDHEMNVDAFLEQARAHAEGVGAEQVTKAFLFVLYNWQLTHPQVLYRAKGLDEWHQSGAYATILRGEYVRDATGGSQLGAQVSCPNCRLTMSSTVRHCPRCGCNVTGPNHTPSTPTVEANRCADCGTQMPLGVNFCPNCGKPAPALAQPRTS